MELLTYVIVIFLVLLSGIFSGLTLGLMSLNMHSLQRKVKLGNKHAKRLYPVRKQGNLLLCTLLLGNVAVNAILSIFLGSITSGVLAAVISTALIVIFGEIIPQAAITRYALPFGSRMVWLVYFFLGLFYVIAKPISLVLDKALGRELPTIFSKREIRMLLEEQSKLKDSDLDKDEAELLRKGLFFSDKQVKDVMTPRVNVFMVKEDEKITELVREDVHKNGHSRIPVYKETQDRIVGMLYAKDLITKSINKTTVVKKIMRKRVEYVAEDDQLDKVLRLFRKKQIHLFVVKDEFGGVSGIITLEDVIEEITGEIIDEYDSVVDMRKRQ